MVVGERCVKVSMYFTPWEYFIHKYIHVYVVDGSKLPEGMENGPKTHMYVPVKIYK